MDKVLQHRQIFDPRKIKTLLSLLVDVSIKKHDMEAMSEKSKNINEESKLYFRE